MSISYFSAMGLRRFFFILLLALAFGCADETQPEKSWEEIVATNDPGDFRGINIGDDIVKVLDKESSNVVHTMPDELTCRIPLDQKESTFYEITYNFNEHGLYVIDLIIYPQDSADTQELFSEFKDYYDKKYGASSDSDGFTAWYTKSGAGSDLEISMIDESEEKGRPFLSITFFEADGIAP